MPSRRVLVADASHSMRKGNTLTLQHLPRRSCVEARDGAGDDLLSPLQTRPLQDTVCALLRLDPRG